MPLYRYQCDNCGHTFAVLEPAGGDLMQVCERCGALEARRVLSRVGVFYRGSGFHRTDYRRSGKRNHHEVEQKGKQEEKRNEKQARLEE